MIQSESMMYSSGVMIDTDEYFNVAEAAKEYKGTEYQIRGADLKRAAADGKIDGAVLLADKSTWVAKIPAIEKYVKGRKVGAPVGNRNAAKRPAPRDDATG